MDLISGKFFNSRFSTSVVVFVPSVSEIEGAMVTRIRISPSSNDGVNSEPSRDPAKPPTAKNMPHRTMAKKRLRTKNPAAPLTIATVRPGLSGAFLPDRRITEKAMEGAIRAA